jgi:hypothetical protein
MKMKASTSTASLLFAMIIMVVAHPLSTWAHQDDSVSVNTASASESTSGVAILRGVKTDQEERNLAKGGNKPSKNDPTSSPTAAVTPSPTPAPAVVTPAPTIFPVVPYDSCGTRSPVATTSTPTPAPNNEVQCTNPKNCNNTPCCPGSNCIAKKCEADNVRHLRERKLPFEKPTTEERKLAVCQVSLPPESCNIHNNEPLCGVPINAPEPIFCNYDNAPNITKCTVGSLCCEDGNGGYYYGLSCWSIAIGGTCCPKGYAKEEGGGCIPLDGSYQ